MHKQAGSILIAGIASAFALLANGAETAGHNVPVPNDRIYLGVVTGEGTSPARIEKAIAHRFDFVDVSTEVPGRLGGGSILKGLKKLAKDNPLVMVTLHPGMFSLHDTISNAPLSGGLSPDDFYARWAAAAKAYGMPMFIRWDHEMNVPGYPYCVADSERCRDPKSDEPQTPADYVAAWRHVHDIFTRAGATNVSWVWCPSYLPAPGDNDFSIFSQLYPGDDYVDWTCLDVYNNILVQHGWKSFSEVFDAPYTKIRQIAPNKPFMIGEFNSMADPFDPRARAEWFRDAMLVQIPHHPGIKAVSLWEDDRRGNPAYNLKRQIDWTIENDPAVLAAFKQALTAAPYKVRPSGVPQIGEKP